MTKPSFLRHAAVYGLGHMLLYVGGIVLLPLYTKCLRPEDYGVLELLNRIGEVMNLCLLYTALRQAAITFHNQASDEAERHRVVSTLLLLLFSVGILGAAVMSLAAPYLSAGLEVGDADLLRLAAVAALLEGTTFALLALPQARTESALFVLINVTQLVLRVSLSVWFVWGLEWGVRGVLSAAALTSSVYVVGLSLREWLRAGTCFDRQKLWEFLRFCLPFLPGGLCLFVLNSGDRFLLLHFAGKEAVGVYALGYKLAAVVTTLSVTPLLMVWSARMYDAAREEDAPEVFGRMTSLLLGAHLLLGLGVCVFQDEAVALLAGPKYAAAASVVAPVVLAYWLLSAVSLMDAGFYVRRRTELKTGITAAATVVVLLLYAALIPLWGCMGAALATVGGFAFQAALTRRIVQRVFFVRYEDRRLMVMLGTAILLWATSRLLPAALWAAPLKVGLWALWPVLLWNCGAIAAEEKRRVLSAVHEMARRWQPAGKTFTAVRWLGRRIEGGRNP